MRGVFIISSIITAANLILLFRYEYILRYLDEGVASLGTQQIQGSGCIIYLQHNRNGDTIECHRILFIKL